MISEEHLGFFCFFYLKLSKIEILTLASIGLISLKVSHFQLDDKRNFSKDLKKLTGAFLSMNSVQSIRVERVPFWHYLGLDEGHHVTLDLINGLRSRHSISLPYSDISCSPGQWWRFEMVSNQQHCRPQCLYCFHTPRILSGRVPEGKIFSFLFHEPPRTRVV